MNSKILGSSPRTTILGIIAAVIGAVLPFLPEEYQKIGGVILAVIAGIYGRLSKDSNGISRKETPVLKQVIEEKQSEKVI